MDNQNQTGTPSIGRFFQFNGAVLTEMNHAKSPDPVLAGQLSVLPVGVAGFSLIIEVSVHCLIAECPSPYASTLPVPCNTAGLLYHLVLSLGSKAKKPSSMLKGLSSIKTQVLLGPGRVMFDDFV